MPRYELAIFDFDGTLADSRDWAIAELGGAAQRFGFRAVGAAEIEMLRGRTSREITTYLGIPFWKVPQITAHMRERMAADAERIALFPGVAPALEALAQGGVRLAIVSSNSESNVRKILGPSNAARIERFSCGTGIFGKARRLRSVMRRSGVSPARTVCVGDETRDIEAAQEAGADSAAVTWGYANAQAFARFRPTWTFETFAEAVLAILGPEAPGR
jgi:phosphoglycolate phosphatase